MKKTTLVPKTNRSEPSGSFCRQESPASNLNSVHRSGHGCTDQFARHSWPSIASTSLPTISEDRTQRQTSPVRRSDEIIQSLHMKYLKYEEIERTYSPNAATKISKELEKDIEALNETLESLSDTFDKSELRPTLFLRPISEKNDLDLLKTYGASLLYILINRKQKGLDVPTLNLSDIKYLRKLLHNKKLHMEENFFPNLIFELLLTCELPMNLSRLNDILHLIDQLREHDPFETYHELLSKMYNQPSLQMRQRFAIVDNLVQEKRKKREKSHTKEYMWLVDLFNVNINSSQKEASFYAKTNPIMQGINKEHLHTPNKKTSVVTGCERTPNNPYEIVHPASDIGHFEALSKQFISAHSLEKKEEFLSDLANKIKNVDNALIVLQNTMVRIYSSQPEKSEGLHQLLACLLLKKALDFGEYSTIDNDILKKEISYNINQYLESRQL